MSTKTNYAFAVQLKKLYRGIVSLETKFLSEKIVEDDPEEGRILLEECGKDLPDEDVEVQKCNKLIGITSGKYPAYFGLND